MTKYLTGILRLVGLFVFALSGPMVVGQTPVAHWTFDDDINNYDLTTIADIVNGNDAEWQNVDEEMNFDTSGLSFTAGQIGGAVRLAGGVNDFFRINAIPQIDGIVATPPFGGGDPELGVGVTWSAWMYIDDSVESNNKGIFASRTVTDVVSVDPEPGKNWGMNWENRTYIDSRVSSTPGGTDTPVGSITRNNWHHVVLVWGNVDDTVAPSLLRPAHRIYIDGELENERENSGTFELVSSGSWDIGNDECCTGREFEGLLDDFAVFDSALSTADVQALYNDGLNGINASDVATDPVLPGDVDGMNGVTIDDFEIIRANLSRSVSGRNLGDLDGSRKVDLDDFLEWLDHAPAALHGEALAALGLATVPEPSSVVLLAMTLTAGLGLYRCKR